MDGINSVDTGAWSLSTIRHGETDFNVQRRYAGAIDIPLNETGRRDTCRAAEHLAPDEFDLVLSSPLQRTMETASLLVKGKRDIIPVPDACERNYGEMQGRTGPEVEKIRPPILYIRIANDYHSLNPPHGETLDEVYSRATRFHQDLLSDYAGKRILLVSHGVFLQQLHGVIRGKDWMESLECLVHNLEMTTFHFEARALVREEHVMLGSVPDRTW